MSRAASTFALVVSGSVLLGWQLELPILRTILPGRAAMSPLTAVTFVLVATALWLETESSGGHRPIRWLARAAAGLVLLVGLVTVFGYDLGRTSAWISRGSLIDWERTGSNPTLASASFS